MYVPQFLSTDQLDAIRQSVDAPAGAPVAVYDGGGFPPHYDSDAGKVCVPHSVVCKMFGRPQKGCTWAARPNQRGPR